MGEFTERSGPLHVGTGLVHLLSLQVVCPPSGLAVVGHGSGSPVIFKGTFVDPSFYESKIVHVAVDKFYPFPSHH